MKKIFNIILVVSLFILMPFICVGCKNETENTITITFDSNGGDKIKSIEIKPGSKISKPKDINKKGYSFNGWCYNDEEWNFIGFIATEDMCLKAEWTPIAYSISYELNGGAIRYEDLPSSYTIEDRIKTINSLSYHPGRLLFDGWYLDALFTQKIDSLDCALCKNVTLYAKWTDTFYINNIDDFNAFTTNSLLYDKNIYLTNDINFNNQNINSIDNFEGVFNGNGHKIYNFILNSSDVNCGLFSYINNAEIKNLAIENFTLNQSSKGVRTGILVGKADNSLIANCYAQNGSYNITCESGCIGGLIGELLAEQQDVYVQNCYTNCNITANANIGGLIGIIKGAPYYIATKKSLIQNCYTICNIMSITSTASGLIASTENKGIEIRNCFSISNLESKGDKLYSSRLAGIARYSSLDEIVLENCYFINNTNLKEKDTIVSHSDLYDSQRIVFESYENITIILKSIWENYWNFETEFPRQNIFIKS